MYYTWKNLRTGEIYGKSLTNTPNIRFNSNKQETEIFIGSLDVVVEKMDGKVSKAFAKSLLEDHDWICEPENICVPLDGTKAEKILDSRKWRTDVTEGVEDGGVGYFETYGEDMKKVQSANPLKVWTITEENGRMHLENAIRFANRLNYLIEV